MLGAGGVAGKGAATSHVRTIAPCAGGFAAIGGIRCPNAGEVVRNARHGRDAGTLACNSACCEPHLTGRKMNTTAAIRHPPAARKFHRIVSPRNVTLNTAKTASVITSCITFSCCPVKVP